MVYISEDERILFCGLADGQSGKKYCREGARISLECTAAYFKKNSVTELMNKAYTDEAQFALIKEIRQTLEKLAQQYDAAPEDFASTIIALVIDLCTGEFAALHLGDGCILGYAGDYGVKVMSGPDCGTDPRYTWLTTSKQALYHIRISFGSIHDWDRILLMTDGARCICHGANVHPKAKNLIKHNEAPQLGSYLMNSYSADDASCIVIEVLYDEETGI